MSALNRSFFVDALKQTIGIEMAQQTVDRAVIEAGLAGKTAFDKDEALRICEILMSKGGYVTTIANILSTRIIVSSIKDRRHPTSA